MLVKSTFFKKKMTRRRKTTIHVKTTIRIMTIRSKGSMSCFRLFFLFEFVRTVSLLLESGPSKGDMPIIRWLVLEDRLRPFHKEL